MISKIGVNLSVNNVSFRASEPVIKGDEKTINKLIQESNDSKGLEALAVYNSVMLNKPNLNDKLYVEPVTPFINSSQSINDIEGEKIYSSDGKLNSIVKRDENTITVYTPDENDNDRINLIQKFDKLSGEKLIKEQRSIIDDGDENVWVDEYNPITGKVIKTTRYDNGNLFYAEKYEYDNTGKEKNITYYYNEKEYAVSTKWPDKQRELYAEFNEDKQIEYFNETNSSKMKESSTVVHFYNGSPISVSVTNEMTFPNTSGIEKFINSDELKPALYYEKIKNIKDINGEKTYYSNGALESNTFSAEEGKVVAHFQPDGRCDRITSDNREILFKAEGQIITEHTNDGKTKKTEYFKNYTQVDLRDENSYKTIEYKNNIPHSYCEGNIIDGKDNDTLCFLYNNAGCLTDVYRSKN